MLIGLDIDDVLYQTSTMIRKLAPTVFEKANVNFSIDENCYPLHQRCGVSEKTWQEQDKNFEWLSYDFFNEIAICELKRLQRINPDIKYCIVTWREEKYALPVAQILREYFYMDISGIHSLPIGTNKAEFCENNKIDVLFDDLPTTVSSFTDKMNSRGVLVATSDILHNNSAVADSKYVLTDWSNLSDTIQNILRERGVQQC